MNVDEIQIILRLITGHWPSPPLSDDEMNVWTHTLLPLNFDATCDVLDLISTAGRTFRPNDGEFMAEYKMHLKIHPPKITSAEPPQLGGPRSFCGHSLNVVACPEAVEFWVTKCREQIKELVGPLAKGFRMPQPTERE